MQKEFNAKHHEKIMNQKLTVTWFSDRGTTVTYDIPMEIR